MVVVFHVKTATTITLWVKPKIALTGPRTFFVVNNLIVCQAGNRNQ